MKASFIDNLFGYVTFELSGRRTGGLYKRRDIGGDRAMGIKT